MMSGDPQSLVERLWRAAILLLATAFAMYVAWWLIKPVLPALIVAVLLLTIFKFAVSGFGRRRHW